MIDPEFRLYAGSGGLLVGGPYSWYIHDFDQRKVFTVTYDPAVKHDEDDEWLQATEGICIEMLEQHLDDIPEGAFGIRFSELNGPITYLTDRLDDNALYSVPRPLSHLGLTFPVKVVSMERLVELDRFGANVDLVQYESGPAPAFAEGADGQKTTTIKAAFKYWFLPNGMFRYWQELGDWVRLPRDHPHIVPFDAVVVDEAEGGVIGFTSIYVPGGTMQETDATIRPFRLRWLRQLLSVVDDLNFRYGVVHQDVAPRNLVVDEADNLRIFDFNFSVMVSDTNDPGRGDTKGVTCTLYEIITLDRSIRNNKLPEDVEVDALLRLDWAALRHPRVQLDADVAEFRALLDDWLAERARRGTPQPTASWIYWTPLPPAPLKWTELSYPEPAHMALRPITLRARRNMISQGEPRTPWERPASYRLREALAEKRAKRAEREKEKQKQREEAAGKLAGDHAEEIRAGDKAVDGATAEESRAGDKVVDETTAETHAVANACAGHPDEEPAVTRP